MQYLQQTIVRISERKEIYARTYVAVWHLIFKNFCFRKRQGREQREKRRKNGRGEAPNQLCPRAPSTTRHQ